MTARLLLAALTFATIASAEVVAQRAPSPLPVQFWIEAGLGGGVASRDGYGLSGHLDMRGLHGRTTYAVRLSATSGGPTEYDAFMWGAIADEFFEGAALVGFAPTRTSGGGFVFEAGPSLVWGNRVVPDDEPCSFLCNDFKRVDFGPVMGLSLGVGAEGDIWPVFGYSVRVHANLNSEQPFAGLTLGARLGKLR